MDVTETVGGGFPAAHSGEAQAALMSPGGASLSVSDPDTELRRVLDRVLQDIPQDAGRRIGRDELLLHLLQRPGELGQEALRHLGIKPERLHQELARRLGLGGDVPAAKADRTPWPLVRWAWIAAVAGVGSYPLSVGPVMGVVHALGLDDAVSPAFEMIYAPLIWLYDALPWVEAFYDWYLPFFGLA